MYNQAAQLSRRERQLMNIIYANGELSAAEVHERLDDPPGYSTIRKLLSILVEKGHLKHRKQGTKYYYRPTKPRDKEGKSALMRVLQTFYGGSLESAVAALVRGRDSKITDEELARLNEIIAEARRNGK